jgi:hypothetical protein
LSPDITFLGFALTEAAATTGGNGYGYFFVLQQQPTEPRFGLEPGPPTKDNPVTQQYFVQPGQTTGASSNAPPRFASATSLNGTLPPLPAMWGVNSADMAKLTFMKPKRVDFYAPLMLPRDST